MIWLLKLCVADTQNETVKICEMFYMKKVMQKIIEKQELLLVPVHEVKEIRNKKILYLFGAKK